MANYAKKYAQIVQKSAKSGRIALQRVGDSVYICTGHTGAEVPAAAYDLFFRPLSPLFPALADGARATKQPGDALPALDAHGLDIAAVLGRSCCDIPAELLPLTYDDGGRVALRLVRVGARLVGYDTACIAAAVELTGGTPEASASSDTWPGLMLSGMGARVLVLPVNTRANAEFAATIATVRGCSQ